ncbi:MAG: vitamin K epoxide reductase family protein [Thermoplasmata archaeon]
MKAENLHALIPVALGAGLLLSIYAAYETVNPAAQSSCSFTAFFSCGKVVESGRTTTLGIADYWYGIGGFLAMIAVDVPLYRTWDRSWLKAFLALSTLGLILSVYLFALETFEIGAICPVCLGTYIANGIALAAAVVLWRNGRPDRIRSGSPVDPTSPG